MGYAWVTYKGVSTPGLHCLALLTSGPWNRLLLGLSTPALHSLQGPLKVPSFRPQSLSHPSHQKVSPL